VKARERHTGRGWTFFAVDADLHIGSLHPYYFYDFNISATTIGMGPFSSTYSVLTLPEGTSLPISSKLTVTGYYKPFTAPTAAPEQLTASSRTSTSLTLTWNPPPFEDPNGPIQYYRVNVTEVDTNTTLASRTTFATQITYRNLHPYYIYRCTVATYTVGIGPYAAPITVQLNQERMCQ